MATLNYFQGYILRGTTDVSVDVSLVDISTGRGRAAIAHTSITVRWWDDVNRTVTTVTPAALGSFNAAHSDGGWYEADGTNALGMYRLDMPDAAFASGNYVTIVVQETGGNTHDYKEVIPLANGVTVPDSVTVSGVPTVNVTQWNSAVTPVTKFATSIDGFIVGTATGGTTTTISGSDAVGFGDGYFNSTANITRTLTFDSNAANPNVTVKIASTSGYTSATGAFTFAEALPTAVVNTDKFVING